MNKINFQDEFINKYNVIDKYPLDINSDGYLISKGKISAAFSDFIIAPYAEYQLYFENVQYFSSDTEEDVSWRLQNLYNYLEINKQSPQLVSINSVPSDNIELYNKMLDLIQEDVYTFIYLKYGQIDLVDLSKINEIRNVYNCGNNYNIADGFRQTLEIHLDGSDIDIKELDLLFDKFENIIVRDVKLTHTNKHLYEDLDVYKNIDWYVSSHKKLDAVLETFFSKDRSSSIVYWSSDLDRLLCPQYEGQSQFNFLDFNDEVIK